MSKSIRRKVTYKIYPSNQQKSLLADVFESQRNLYNSLLEQRIYAYKYQGKSYSFEEQCKDITQLRKEFPEYEKLNAQSLQVTAKRLDLAYKAFFSRLEKGEKAGFPRFKSNKRFSGWGYKKYGDGWGLAFSHATKVTNKNKTRSGVVRISGVGEIRVRGMARNEGMPKTMEVFKKGVDWFISVTFVCKPQRKSGDNICAFDWGVVHFLTIADEKEDIHLIENPRFYKEASEKIANIQRLKKDKKLHSKNTRKVNIRLARFHRKVARCRLDFMHKNSTKLVEGSKRLFTEELEIANITKSPKPKQDPVTLKYLSNKSAQKAGLNKSILDTSPSRFLNMVRVKAVEAGYALEELETKKLKPSQRCAQCGYVVKKKLSERQHSCSECGFSHSRDANSALVMLRYGLGHLKLDFSNARSRGPALCLEMPQGISNHETPTIFMQ